MNDVLPKPFTKEGLITMLDKHLSHLKQNPAASMSPMEPPPPPLSAVSKRSTKIEDSPGTSPATTANWHSPNPNHFSSGVSPASTHEDSYYVQGGYPIQPTPPLYNSAPGTMVGAPQRPLQPQQPARRNISDISGGPDMNDAKRQQMYPPAAVMSQPNIQPRPPR